MNLLVILRNLKYTLNGRIWDILRPLDLCLLGWMNSKVYRRKVDTPDELLFHISDAAACMDGGDGQLRRTTRELQGALRLALGLSDIYCEI